MITFQEEHQENEATSGDKLVTDGRFPEYQAYKILYAGYILLPILAGADKFFELLGDWDRYLAPIIPSLLFIDAQTVMYGVGIIEIAAGILTAVRPRVGGYVLAFWLWGVIVNLLLIPGFYDVALRDFGLSLGAWSLAKLSEEFE